MTSGCLSLCFHDVITYGKCVIDAEICQGEKLIKRKGLFNDCDRINEIRPFGSGDRCSRILA